MDVVPPPPPPPPIIFEGQNLPEQTKLRFKNLWTKF